MRKYVYHPIEPLCKFLCAVSLSIRKPGSNPFAFIVFGDYESGQKAIREMHDTELGGEIISVKWSHTSIEAKAFEEEDAKAERERDDEEEPFSTIFVRNVDSLARLSDLRSFGSRVGPVYCPHRSIFIHLIP